MIKGQLSPIIIKGLGDAVALDVMNEKNLIFRKIRQDSCNRIPI